MQTIKINWYGPFSNDDLYADERPELFKEKGLYLFAGKRAYQRKDTEIQYFGITDKSYSERFNGHKKLHGETHERVNNQLEIWLGILEYPLEYNRTHLEDAETSLVYFWQPSLNDRKKKNKPKTPTIVISNWFNRNRVPRFNQKKIYKELPDVIIWDGDYWRTGNLKVFED